MKPTWKPGERFVREGEISAAAPPAAVFPLLCPVREYEWIPDWRCTMVYSASGVAEENAVFITPQKFHRKTLWTLITYEPPRRVEYLIVMGTDAAVRLTITLEERAGATRLRWRFLFTAISPMARRMLPADFTEEKFQHMLRTREKQLNSHLETPGARSA